MHVQHSATFFFNVLLSPHLLIDENNPCLERSSVHKYPVPNLHADKFTINTSNITDVSSPSHTMKDLELAQHKQGWNHRVDWLVLVM